MSRFLSFAMRLGYWMIIVPIFTIFALIVVSILLIAFLNRNWERRSIPEKIKVSKVILAQDVAGGFLEGCQFVAYELEPETAAQIKAQGLQFFAGIDQPPLASSKNRYESWRQAPVPQNPNIFARNAESGCNNDSAVRDAIGPIDFGSDRAFYSTTGNREGMIMVFPERALAVYMYFG